MNAKSEEGFPSERLQVFPQGMHRIRISATHRDSPLLKILANWLTDRPEVVRLSQRPETGTLYIDYDDGEGLRGRFLRALRDKIYALSARKSGPLCIEKIHATSGRIRVRLRDAKQQQLHQLAACAATLTQVKQVHAEPCSYSLLILFDPRAMSETELLSALERSSLSDFSADSRNAANESDLGMVSASTLLVASLTRSFSPSLLSLGVLIHALRPLRRSLQSLSQGEVSVDLLDVAGTLAALATGQLATAAFIVFMVEVGDLLISLSAKRASTAIAQLMRMETPDAFRLTSSGGTERVPAHLLKKGDRIIVAAGQRIAADGLVLSGEALIDEKALTGESMLHAKHLGDRVLAATVLVEGQLLVEVEESGKDTAAAQAIKILESACQKPLTLQRQALESAGKLVLPTFAAAFLAALISSDIHRAASILITDFGAGIRVAVPAIALFAMTVAAKKGILFKGAQYFERLARTDVIVFDKTGTLTEGEPEIVDMVTVPGFSESLLISLGASLEARHRHPIAHALLRYAEKNQCELVEPELGSEAYALGRGLKARAAGHEVLLGNVRWMQENHIDVACLGPDLARFAELGVSVLLIAIDGKIAGAMGYADRLRPESSALVQTLKQSGRRKIWLLSGDVRSSVTAIAQAVGIDEAHCGLLPEDKAFLIKKLSQEGAIVAMVGDGINDAPALAVADVGISLESGTDVAVETADVVLLEGGLLQLEEAFMLSHRAMSGVKLGLGLILIPNALGILLGLCGLLPPPVAALVNNGATLASLAVGTVPLLTQPRRRKAKRPVGDEVRIKTRSATVAAGLFSAVLSPVPMADELALFLLYGDLSRRIAKSHGLGLSRTPWQPILRTIANALLARAALMLPVSFIPGMATAVSSASAVALTQVLGRYIDEACRAKMQVHALGIKELGALLEKVMKDLKPAPTRAKNCPRQK